jgi:thioredoxin 1
MNYNFKKPALTLLFPFAVLIVFFSLSFTFHQNKSEGNKKGNKIETLNSDNFDDFVKDKLVLVDFWASWCYPCRLQNPILDEVNTEMGNKVKIGKVNVDENRMLSNTYGIVSIPTLLVFKKGKVVERLSGLQQKPQLVATLQKHMD